MPRLHPEYGSFVRETDRLLALLASTSMIGPAHRKVVAEIVHLRLAILLENHLKQVFGKLCCAAPYLDGSAPVVLAVQRSSNAAYLAMKTLNRAKDHHTKWNDGRGIRQGVRYLIDSADHSMTVLRNFGAFLTEVRYIRNHVAHRNDGTRVNFRKLIRKYYGASPPGINSGTLLLSDRVSKPPLIEVHIRTARVLLKELVKG
jgi:hypothetical protein